MSGGVIAFEARRIGGVALAWSHAIAKSKCSQCPCDKVRRINAVLQHPKHPWMLANLVREVMGATDVQILECKTAGINGARLWRDGVPEYVQLQVTHPGCH